MNILLMTDKLILAEPKAISVNWKVICVMMILRFIQLQVMENYMNLLLEKKILYYLVDGII